jgi:hypothetical protein
MQLNGGRTVVKHGAWAVVAMGLALAVTGCGGPGETIKLAASVDAAPAPEKVRSPLRVAVIPFEDVRADKASIGRYQHYVETRVDTLVPERGSAAEQVTAFVAEYLKRAGFQVTRVPQGGAVPSGSADVVLSGRIESYWNEAVSRFFRTELMSQNRLVVTVSNAVDSSTVRASVAGDATTKVVSFSLADLEQLNGEALGVSLARFLGDVVVADRALKPRK